MKKINFKKIGKFIPIIGVILFIYIIYDIGIEKIAQSFVSIPIYLFIIATLPFFIRVSLTCYKWQYICKKQKINLSFRYLLKITFICIYYAVITPGELGIYLRLFYLRKKSDASIGKCIANSWIDVQTGVIAGLFLGVIGSYLLIDFDSIYLGIFYPLLALLIFHIAANLIIIKKGGGGRIANIFIKPLIPKKYKEKFAKSIDSLYEDIPRIRDLIIPIILDFLMFFFLALQTYIIALAFSIDMPFHIFLVIHTISIVVISFIPISVGGLGVREGTFVLLMAPFGVETSVAFVISFSGWIVKSLIPAIFGLFLSFRAPLDK